MSQPAPYWTSLDPGPDYWARVGHEMAARFPGSTPEAAPAPVGFQFGYPSDRPWWHQLQDPPGDIGSRILNRVPNTEALFWVDFSMLEVFPPDQQ